MKLRFCVWYIARKYLQSKHQSQSIHTMIGLCFWGIMIATCALMLVVSIMQGFKSATYTKMQSIYPDLIVEAGRDPGSFQRLSQLVEAQHLPLKAWALRVEGQALLVDDEDAQQLNMVQLVGIVPDDEQQVSSIHKKIKSPDSAVLAEVIHSSSILIGKALADRLHVDVGDTVSLMYSQTTMFMTRSFQTVPVEVGGIFATGIDDIDASVVYADFNLVERIMGDQSYYQIHIALSQLRSEQHVQASIKQALELEVYSWKDLYPALLSALTLEKWAMFFILLLIVCVASMNIVALMSMLVVHKRKDIMILLLQGMSLSEVEWIFILIGLYIACKAIVVGLALALAIGFVLQKYPFIKLPDNLYDTEYLPISIELSNIVIIAFATIVISLLASLYATKSIRSYSMVELLKN